MSVFSLQPTISYFEFEETIVVSRLIEGEYFRIDQMLSSDYETKITVNKRELLSCIDRATLLVKEGDKKPIIIHITDGSMELKINSQIGSMKEDIDIEKEGKDILIGFNPRFLMDALRVHRRRDRGYLSGKSEGSLLYPGRQGNLHLSHSAGELYGLRKETYGNNYNQR